MLDLRRRVCDANQSILRLGLAPLTWGNASALEGEIVAIKPSGVAYDDLRPADIVLIDLRSGEILEDGRKPSSDTETHLALYRAFPGVHGIVHTHSRAASAWSQACMPIPCLGTTHADHFCGEVPVTRELSTAEVAHDYGAATGRAIVEAIGDPMSIPGALVAHHAPFVWGPTLEVALENAVALERIAEMALQTMMLNPELTSLPEALRRKHFERKHGGGYGQG